MNIKLLFNDIGVLFLRVSLGSMLFFAHGLGKLEKLFSGNLQFADPLGIGPQFSFVLITLAEGLMSLAVIFGILTRLAVIPIVFGMMVAVLVAHGADPFAVKEKALLFAVGFFTLMFTGPGKFSGDYFICKYWHKRKKSKK